MLQGRWGQCGLALKKVADTRIAASWPVDLSMLELLLLQPRTSVRSQNRQQDLAVLMASTNVEEVTIPRTNPAGPKIESVPANAGLQRHLSLPEVETETKQAAVPVSKLTDIARRFTVYYLGYWSRTNDIDATIVALFYSPDVWLRGKRSDIAGVVKDKQRLVDLWPVRDNDPLLETMKLTCNDQARQCRVRMAYTFFAAYPDKGREKYGTGIIDLTISFSSGEPRIVSELDKTSDDLLSALP